MPRARAKRRVHRMWDVGMMERAVRDVKEGRMTIRHAASYYGVPKTSLYDKVKGRSSILSRPGPKPRLSAELERELYDLAMEKETLGMSKNDFLTLAGDFAAERGKPFRTGTPSLNWYRKFMKRQKEMTEIEIQRNISREKMRPQPTWSPSKRKSTKPRRAKVDQSDSERSTMASDSEIESESERELSSLPSSSESEVEPPKPKRQKRTKKRAAKKKKPPTPKKPPSTPKKTPKIIIRPLPKKETPESSEQDDSDDDDDDDIMLDSEGENMKKAINAIKKGDMTYKRAAQYFNVPKSTLHDHVRKGYTPGARRGTKPTLSSALEKQLFEVARNREELGLSKVDFLEMAGELAAENRTPFKNGRPSESWYLKMMQRGNRKRGKWDDEELSSPSKNTSDHQYSIPTKLPGLIDELSSDYSLSPRKGSPNKSDAVRRIRSALEEHLTRPTIPVQKNVRKVVSIDVEEESEAESGHVVVDSVDEVITEVVDQEVKESSSPTMRSPVYDRVRSDLNQQKDEADGHLSIEAKGIKLNTEDGVVRIHDIVPANQIQGSVADIKLESQENGMVIQVIESQTDQTNQWNLVQETENVQTQIKQESRTLDPAIFTSDEAVQNAVLSLLEVSDRTALEAKAKATSGKTVVPKSSYAAQRQKVGNLASRTAVSEVVPVATQRISIAPMSTAVVPVGTVFVGASEATSGQAESVSAEVGTVVPQVQIVPTLDQINSCNVQVLEVESMPEVKSEEPDCQIIEMDSIVPVADENVVTEEIVGFVIEEATYVITDGGILINSQDIQ